MTEPRLPSTADVVVVGGGLMGRSSAWRLAAAGLDVVLVVGETAAAASTVAAGMLAPVTETTFTEELLLGLNLASMRRYRTFSAEVEEASGLPSGFRAGLPDRPIRPRAGTGRGRGRDRYACSRSAARSPGRTRAGWGTSVRHRGW